MTRRIDSFTTKFVFFYHDIIDKNLVTCIFFNKKFSSLQKDQKHKNSLQRHLHQFKPSKPTLKVIKSKFNGSKTLQCLKRCIHFLKMQFIYPTCSATGQCEITDELVIAIYRRKTLCTFEIIRVFFIHSNDGLFHWDDAFVEWNELWFMARKRITYLLSARIRVWLRAPHHVWVFYAYFHYDCCVFYLKCMQLKSVWAMSLRQLLCLPCYFLLLLFCFIAMKK